jgi:hypothetical protein
MLWNLTLAPPTYGLIANIAVAIVVPLAAIAHEPSESIQRFSYRVAAGKGGGECTLIQNAGVTIVPHGFLINDSNEFVPQDESQPSMDGNFWRCGSAAQRTFFLVPLDRY